MCAYTPSAASVSHRRPHSRAHTHTHSEEILVNESLRGCWCLRTTVLLYVLSSWAKNKDHTEWGVAESYKTQFKVTRRVFSRHRKLGFETCRMICWRFAALWKRKVDNSEHLPGVKNVLHVFVLLFFFSKQQWTCLVHTYHNLRGLT